MADESPMAVGGSCRFGDCQEGQPVAAMERRKEEPKKEKREEGWLGQRAAGLERKG